MADRAHGYSALMRYALLRAALPLAALAPLLGGCGETSKTKSNGIESKSPTAIVEAAKKAADEATAVHVSGAIKSNGTPVTLDLSLVSGKGGSGKLSEGGLSFELIRIGSTAYIKGSEAFYKHFGGSATASLLKGKWLKAPTTSEQFSMLATITDPRKLLDMTLASHGKLEKAKTTTVNGQEAVPVRDLTQGGTLYVSTIGKPYPVQITKGGSSGGSIAFDKWDEPVELKAPASSETVDITKLQSGH